MTPHEKNQREALDEALDNTEYNTEKAIVLIKALRVTYQIAMPNTNELRKQLAFAIRSELSFAFDNIETYYDEM